jgi:hypothetical protein
VVEELEQRHLLTLTLTADGQAAGFGLSTFATGFPEQSGHVGPWGMVFPASGGVLVSDAVDNVRLFPSDSDGQNAATVPPVSSVLAPSGPAGMARVGANVYLMMTGPNQVAQLNDVGTVNKVVATVPSPLGVAVNPLNGHLGRIHAEPGLHPQRQDHCRDRPGTSIKEQGCGIRGVGDTRCPLDALGQPP